MTVRDPHEPELGPLLSGRIHPPDRAVARTLANATFSFDALSYAGRSLVSRVDDRDLLPDHVLLADTLDAN